MGEWAERDTSFLGFDVVNCSYCGKVIPRRVYFETVSATRLPFCGPRCLARHGTLHVDAGKEPPR